MWRNYLYEQCFPPSFFNPTVPTILSQSPPWPPPSHHSHSQRPPHLCEDDPALLPPREGPHGLECGVPADAEAPELRTQLLRVVVGEDPMEVLERGLGEREVVHEVLIEDGITDFAIANYLWTVIKKE